MLQIYQTKQRRVAGTRYREVYDDAFYSYLKIRQSTKRRPYIRSIYFKQQKIFLDLFWRHLHEKNWRDRARRIRFFPAAIELIKYSSFLPISKPNPNHSNEILHRFIGSTRDGEIFYVQIREDTLTGNKSLYSIFPEKNQAKICG